MWIDGHGALFGSKPASSSGFFIAGSEATAKVTRDSYVVIKSDKTGNAMRKVDDGLVLKAGAKTAERKTDSEALLSDFWNYLASLGSFWTKNARNEGRRNGKSPFS